MKVRDIPWKTKYFALNSRQFIVGNQQSIIKRGAFCHRENYGYPTEFVKFNNFYALPNLKHLQQCNQLF